MADNVNKKLVAIIKPPPKKIADMTDAERHEFAKQIFNKTADATNHPQAK